MKPLYKRCECCGQLVRSNLPICYCGHYRFEAITEMEAPTARRNANVEAQSPEKRS